MKHISVLFLLAGLLAGTTSCKKEKEEPASPADNTAALKKSVVSNYADIAYASYSDSYDKAVVLQTAVNAFVDAPGTATLAAAKTAWLDARIPYLQTEAYRFYGGPIDDTDGPEGLINAWPMDEAYIDYVDGDADAGIINDLSFTTLDGAFLASMNEQGETNISTGYHAIEFLLWGQDLNTNGPGNRPYTDYVTGAGGTASNQGRRGDYLKAVAALLVENLKSLADEWAPGATNYRQTFESAPVDESLHNILLGMGSLSGGELAGERMQVAYDTRAQEDEHSCFSDNTHNDIVYDAKGIENLYYGRYTRANGTVIDGVGLDELVKNVNGTLHTRVVARLATSKASVEAIQPPFDQEIDDTAGRLRIAAAIQSLYEEADDIVLIAKSLGLTLVL